MIDLIEKAQEEGLRSLTKPRQPGDSQTLMRRLEEYEAKGKDPKHGPSPFISFPMPKRLGSLAPHVVKHRSNTQLPHGLSGSSHPSDVSLAQSGSSSIGSMSHQSSLMSGTQPSSASENNLPQERPTKRRGERQLRFSALPESEFETLADRRLRLLDVKQPPNQAYKQRASSDPFGTVLSPESGSGRGSSSRGPSGIGSSSLQWIREEPHTSTSVDTELELQASSQSADSASVTQSLRSKTQQKMPAPIQSGLSTSSGSDLGPNPSPSTLGQSGPTPDSTLEMMARLAALEELVQKDPILPSRPANTGCQASCLDSKPQKGKQVSFALKEATGTVDRP